MRAGLLSAVGLILSAACSARQDAADQPADAVKPTEGQQSAPAASRTGDTTKKPAEIAPSTAQADSGTTPATDAPKRGGTLRVGLAVDAFTLDPHLSGGKTDRQVMHNVYEPLVTLGEKLDVKPGLAESWQQTDPRTIVFKLRRGVRFHDGTEFNAQAAKLNFERMQNPDTKSVRRGEIANVEHAEVIDASTLKLNLKRPDAALLAALSDCAGMMISPAAVQKFGPDLQRNPVGTGPFQLTEWAKDDHLSLARFDDYWDKAAGPYLDQIRYRPIPDDSVKAQSLRAGELDAIDYVAPREEATLRGDAGVVVIDVPSLASFAYQLNVRKPPFDRKPLRQALAYAIDTGAITRSVWLGLGVPSNGPIAPSSWAYDEAMKPIARDVAKAKALLSEGGMPDGYAFACTVNNVPANIQEAEAMKAQLTEVGIQLEITPADATTLQANGNAGRFDMIAYQWSGRPDPDGNTYQFFKTAQGPSLNWAGYSNAKVDELLDKSREASDRTERTRLHGELGRALQDDVPWLFVIHPTEQKAFSPKVRGYAPVPDGVIRLKDVWLA